MSHDRDVGSDRSVLRSDSGSTMKKTKNNNYKKCLPQTTKN